MTDIQDDFSWRVLDTPLCALGEGPTYDPHANTAWWFDILGRKLIEHRFSDSTTIVHELPFTASALARIDSGRQLVFAQTGLFIRDVASGTFELHAKIEHDNEATRSNDARVHPSGSFWLGTMAWDERPGAGSIYHYRAGEVSKLFGGISISNAISFSPDGSIGYFADTAIGKVMRVKLDPASGLPVSEPETFLSEFPDGGDPDGAVTDEAGNIWIALWGGGMVAGHTPDGRKLAEIALPASQVTCPAFVGADATQMLVTSARTGLEEAGSHDQSGASFIVKLPFKGRHAPDVLLG